MSRLAALALVAALLTGCSGEEEPSDAAPTEPTPSAEPSEAPPAPALDPLIFYGASGVTLTPNCDPDSPSYVSLYQQAEVNGEIRLGRVEVTGQGRLVGRVLVAPASGRGPDTGGFVVSDEPGLALREVAEWRDRAPLRDHEVQPGDVLLFAQLEVRPGESVQGLDVSYVDGSTHRSAHLDLPVSTEPCPG